MNRATVLSVSVILFFSFILFPPDASSQSQYLREGIEQYKLENYEEAVELLIKARKETPKSSAAAFFLGFTYKQMEDYKNALGHLRDAVTLTPKIKQALVELIDVAVQLGEVEEAKKWIEVAEKEDISPAKMAFIKGQILSKEGKNLEAIESFEKARFLDESLAQAVEFQIALCYMKEKELKKARDQFKAVVLHDPESDMAGFARNFQDMLEKRIELERPFRVTLGISEQFNNNLLSNPKYPEWTSGSNDEKTFAFAPSFRINYVPTLKAPWSLSVQYAASGTFNDKFSNSRDTISNSISVVPGYTFGTYSLNLSTSYTHALLRGPSYERYQDSVSGGPMFRMLVGGKHILEFYAGYMFKEYHDRNDPDAAVSLQQEDKDTTGPTCYVSWIWIFTEGAFFNLKSEYIYDNAEGIWWENDGYKNSVNLTIPLIEKLKFQLSGQAFFQDYRHRHLLLAELAAEREDETYTSSLGLTWEFLKNTDLVAQYTHTRVNSTIGIYEYEQDLYSLGIEYRY